MEGDTQDARKLARGLAHCFWRRRHSPSVILLKLDAEDTYARRCFSVLHLLTYFVAKVNTVERYNCVMAVIYGTFCAPTYFRKTQDISVESTSIVSLKVGRNHHNFRCARTWVAILLASLIFINSQRRQNKRTSLTSMLCSSVVKAFFVPKRGTEIDEDLLCQNMWKSRFQKIGLMFAF